MVRYSLTNLKHRRLDKYDRPNTTLHNTTKAQAEVKGVETEPLHNQAVEQEANISTAQQVDPRAFRDGYEPKANDVFIAIMGVTGAGKSTLISKCTDKQVRIGHNLQACTQEVAVFLCKYSETINVYLVDTPGFDDTDRSDTEILTEIASWLTASYSNAIKLHGLIYLHRITDLRMQGAAKRNLHMFQKLCGTKALNNVILATTMWGEIAEDIAAEREHQLKVTQDFWGYMMDHGSQVLRHYNTRESAISLIGSLLGHAATTPKVVLDIQAQMVDDGKTLADTSAGQAVDDAIAKERERFAKRIANTQASMQEALQSSDRDTANMLKQHKSEMNERVKRLDEEHSALKVSLERLQEQRFAKMQQALEDAERESKRAREAVKQVRLEQDRRLQEALKAGDELVAAQKKEMADQQAKAAALHKRQMEELQSKLRQMPPLRTRVRSHPGVNTMSLWTVSISLWGESHFFVALTSDLSNVKSYEITAARLGANNGNRYIALGEGGACYLHYHDAAGKCWTERSTAFQTRYAEIEAYMKTYEQYGCPTCVSLGHNGQHFIRTAWGCEYDIPADALAHIGADKMSLVQQFWFGKYGAWFADKNDGTISWDLKGQYPGLDGHIRSSLNGVKQIKLIAMNPEDENEWVILWVNGLAAYNLGEKTSIDPFDLEEWCTKNFGTIWNAS